MTVCDQQWVGSYGDTSTDRDSDTNTSWSQGQGEVQTSVEQDIISWLNIHSEGSIVHEGVAEGRLASDRDEVSREDRDGNRGGLFSGLVEEFICGQSLDGFWGDTEGVGWTTESSEPNSSVGTTYTDSSSSIPQS